MKATWQLALGFGAGLLSGLAAHTLSSSAVGAGASGSDEKVLAAIERLQLTVEARQWPSGADGAFAASPGRPNGTASGAFGRDETPLARSADAAGAERVDPAARGARDEVRGELPTARDLERVARAPAAARELVNQAIASKTWRSEDRQKLALLMPYLGAEGPALRGFLIASLNAGRLVVEPDMHGMPF